MGRRKQEEDEYEVEKITDAIVNLKYGKNIEWKYSVKWKGYSKAESTWEPAKSFEDSPNLLEQFWKKADTGGRDPKKASDFSKGEVVTFAEGAIWSEAEGGDEEEKQGGVDESVSPKPQGRKRASALSDGAPQRKRGRPSKADKLSTGKPRKESVGKGAKKSGDDENENSVDKASRRNSRRLSAKASAKMKKLGRMKRMIRGTGDAESSSEDDNDDEESSASQERKGASKQGAETKSAFKKRKTIIESDEDRDAEGSSHDGSLFSGDDEPEPEIVPLQVPEPATQPNSAAEVTPAAQESIDNPKEDPVAPSQDIAQKKEEPKRRQYRKAPKVVTMEDPNVKKSIEARVRGRAHEESGMLRQPSTSSADASISPVESRGGWLAGSSSQPVRAEGGSYKPTLLTFEKGKLTSHRGSTAREAPSPTAPSGSGSAGTIPGPQVGGTIDAVGQRDTLWGESVQESNTMDTSSDFALPTAPSATVLSATSTEVITVEPVSNEPPPTAEELLRLSGASNAALDLPDFQGGEDTNGTITNSTGVTTSTLMSMPSTSEQPSEQPSGVPASQNTWKSSSIFGLPSSSGPFSFFEKILPSSSTRPVQPTKLIIPLRLDPISSVPVILKDVTQPSFGPKLTDLLAQGQDGPPGKLFVPDVINSCVTAGASAARLVPDEGASDEQRVWFTKLIDELDKGMLFVVALGANSFALCSSKNHHVAQKLNVSSSLIGLSRTVIMQHVTITDSTLYMTYAVLAVDLKLR